MRRLPPLHILRPQHLCHGWSQPLAQYNRIACIFAMLQLSFLIVFWEVPCGCTATGCELSSCSDSWWSVWCALTALLCRRKTMAERGCTPSGATTRRPFAKRLKCVPSIASALYAPAMLTPLASLQQLMHIVPTLEYRILHPFAQRWHWDGDRQ